jgi:hypothetical protein
MKMHDPEFKRAAGQNTSFFHAADSELPQMRAAAL